MEREVEVNTGNGGSDIREAASAKLESVKQWSSDMLGQVEGFVRERPGTALLVALGAGFLVGRLIRRV